jgi:hypothetical protein
MMLCVWNESTKQIRHEKSECYGYNTNFSNSHPRFVCDVGLA